MAVKLRLARRGAKKNPFYHIVAADVRSSRDGKFLEKVGTYNPMLPKESENRVVINKDRVDYWFSVGAKATDRVERLFNGVGVLSGYAYSNQTKKHNPKAKAQARMKEKEEAKSSVENSESDSAVDGA